MQKIQLNIIPFTPVENKITFAFYGERDQGMSSIKWDKLFNEFPEGRAADKQFYYSDFQLAREGAIIKEIDVFDATFFAQSYFGYLILNYFKSIEGSQVFPNFARDVEVWFEEKNYQNIKYRLYNKFTLKVQFNNVVQKSYEIVLAYNGTSKVLRKNIGQITDFDTTKYNFVTCKGAVYKYIKMPSHLRQNLSELYPVISNPLKKDFGIEEEFKRENRFPIYLKHLQNFYEKYLNTDVFRKIINISKEGFYAVPDDKVFRTSYNANKLQFLNGQHYNPGLGILIHKPLKAYTEGHLKLFFIYNKSDGDFVKNQLYRFMVEGWHGLVRGKQKDTEPLISYINQPFSFDASKQLAFTNNQTIFEEVKEKLDTFVHQPGVKYVAIYVSPIPKDAKDHPQHKAYYKIKELLLDKEITSQVVYKDHLAKPEFYYFLPNIYVALLAKMNGIPWRLARPQTNELIIGIGAFKPMNSNRRFLGSAFCFSNEGKFENFDCFKDDEPGMIAGSIKVAVENFIKQHQKADRVIIHFYKEISDKKELQPILDMLGEIGEREIPVIVVTINKTDSRELLGFDMNSDGKMPISGTYLSVGYFKFLLFNNTRYFENSKLMLAKDYHFPVKLTFRASREGIIDAKVIKELIDQVYQFSRMYWKSISQQNLPVTTLYPEMVAEIFPHFESDTLPEFGKKNLWFL